MKTYDRTIVFFILAFPSLPGRLGGDDGRRCGLLRRLIVRSVPIRHCKPNPEDEETERKSKREWIEIRSKFRSISLVITGIAEHPNLPVPPATRRDDLGDERRVTQTCFASRQNTWLHPKCAISCRDVLTVREPYCSVERYGRRCSVWRRRRGAKDPYKRLAGRREGLTTDVVHPRWCCRVIDADSEPRERAQDAIEQE